MNRIPLLLLLALGCAPPYDDVPVKLVGVGYDPNEIGPAPTPYNGVVEYSWINFAGGGLSLALMQLGSFDEITSAFAGTPYSSPFAAVYGFSYMFDTPLAAADSLGGITAVPPEVEGACYTTFQASGPIGSFTTVDVGNRLEFTGATASEGFTVDRYPYEYAEDAQGAFVYYLGFDTWRPNAETGYIAPEGATSLDELEPVVVRKANFPFGRTVKFGFPGGLAPAEVPISSLPRSSDSVAGQKSFELPSQPKGVRISWNGPVYEPDGNLPEDGGSAEWSTCLAFSAPVEAPAVAEDCRDAIYQGGGGEERGQLYTGPWDTEDGKVVFEWEPGDDQVADEAVTISVRFLGPVDREDPNYKQRTARIPATSAIAENDEGAIGTRAPNSCEEENVVWEFSPTYLDEDGELVPAMRGDPYNNLAEVTCRLKDADGRFELTNDVVANALEYARIYGAEGAVFYFARSTSMDFAIPPVMDSYGNRRDTAPVKVASRAVEIGRFWLETTSETP